MTKSKKSTTTPKLADEIRALALSLPEVNEDFPWGHSAFKVKGKKAFVFMSEEEGTMSFSLKLPLSRDFALSFPFAEPTGYGLGKSGWVTVRVGKNDYVAPDVVRAWVIESYRAVAPKKLGAMVG